MKAVMLALLTTALVTAGPTVALNLAAARAEPDLEKRSDKALQVADAAFQTVRKVLKEGDAAAETAALSVVRESVGVAIESLADSGKDARRSPKYFKRAEIALRKLIRNLEDYRFAKGADERSAAEELIAFVHQAHDQVLTGIMTRKK
jgi:hypothetical protein